MEAARQMAVHVEHVKDGVLSESYWSARMALSAKLEVEAAKHLAKARSERARGRNQGGISIGDARAHLCKRMLWGVPMMPWDYLRGGERRRGRTIGVRFLGRPN